MYKHSSPEALSLVSLGRADSKRPDTTCCGITTAGKPCRNALKKGSRDKYCHHHRDQQSTYRSKLLGAKTTVTIVEESVEDTSYRHPSLSDHYTLEPSPSPPRGTLPWRNPGPSPDLAARQQSRLPLIQLIPPPTPPLSIHSQNLNPKQRPEKGILKLSKVFRKVFQSNASGKNSTLSKIDATDDSPSRMAMPSAKTIRRNDLAPTRYPQPVSKSGLLHSKPSTPQSSSKSAPINFQKYLSPPSQGPSKLLGATKGSVSTIHSRPPNKVLLHEQARSTTIGIQRSWETMWVPGIDGLGVHIICKEWLSPDLSAVGRQKLLSCMRAPLSKGEESGYIYVYKITEDTSSSKEIFYKVGRAQNLTRRLYQWSRSCPYTPLLVGFFPAPPAETLRRTSSTSSLSSLFRRGENVVAETSSVKMVKCAVTHRVERLIHLELEDRFGRVDISSDGCSCGKIHKEWFRCGERGWTDVRDVIVRWVGFARIAYGDVGV